MASGTERRRHPRFAVQDTVRLTLLSEDGRSGDARIVDISVTGVRIESLLAFHPGSLIKVEWKDTLMLGEVLYCQRGGDGLNVLGVELTRALYGMAELRRLNSHIVGSDVRSAASEPVKAR
jgi:PilZ domain